MEHLSELNQNQTTTTEVFSCSHNMEGVTETYHFFIGSLNHVTMMTWLITGLP